MHFRQLDAAEVKEAVTTHRPKCTTYGTDQKGEKYKDSVTFREDPDDETEETTEEGEEAGHVDAAGSVTEVPHHRSSQALACDMSTTAEHMI